ncbi:MAG: hypothetical protein JOZ54_00490 [Acidobacteria bacterium]|nr:hypothetical protein [Acidobacteriota bacterium]
METTTLELERELRFFEQHRIEWMETVAGKYALVKGVELVGTFDTETEAVGAGFRRFGNEAFLVKRIVEADLPLLFATFNLGM